MNRKEFMIKSLFGFLLKIVLAHERSDMYYIILHLHLISNLQCLFQFSTLLNKWTLR